MSFVTLSPAVLSDANIYYDPITGQWIRPSMVFNTSTYLNLEIDPMNEDPRYHRRMIDYFETKLVENWLYNSPMYRSLLQYFKTTKEGDKVSVHLIDKLEDRSEDNVSPDTEKYVFRMIEKTFITHKFVKKALLEYIHTTHIKWYDLYFSSDTIKDLLRRRLKRKIISAIYKMKAPASES